MPRFPAFGADHWQLAGLDHRHTAGSVTIRWDRFPLPLRAAFKRGCWLLINVPTPAVLHQRPRSATKALLSAKSVNAVCLAWLRFAVWLSGRGISRLADVDAGLLADYARHLRGQHHSTTYHRNQLMALTRLWAYAPFLPPADRIPMPPWDAPGGRADLLDTASLSSGENTTPRVHPAVMSPLLVWALRMVTDLAADIIAARAEHRRIEANIPTTSRAERRSDIRAWLDQHRTTGRPLPGCSLPGLAWRAGRRTTTLIAPVSLRFIAGTLGVTIHQVSKELERQPDLIQELGTAPDAPMDLPVTARLDGRPWIGSLDFEAVGLLTTHLNTAALVVVAYLSGMRPEEVLHLQRGCCTRDDTGDGVVRYRVSGRHFSGVVDEDGNTRPDGEQRAHPWTVIEPVATAICVLERLADGDLLFPRVIDRLPWRRADHVGAAMTTTTAASRIAAFIGFVNDLARRHQRGHEIIPDDPGGRITLSRLRRTVAWFINRLPGGRIALGIQYGHLRLPMSESYAGRSTANMLDLLDLEQARAVADTLTDAADRLAAGDGVSGPAAHRYLTAAGEFAATYPGGYLTKRQHRALLTNPRLQVFDHQQALLACNHNKHTALCHPDRATGRGPAHTPSLDRCQPACANIARTDTHIARAQAEIDRLDAELSASTDPHPIQQRLQARRAALQAIIDAHQAGRITLDDTGQQQ